MRYLYIIVLLLCFGAAEARSDGYTSATKATAVNTTTSPQAELTIKSPSHNFGTHKRRGKDLVHKFAFKNSGSRPLIFLRANTSCSCIKVHYPPHPIAPGEGGYIEVIYEIRKRELGVFSKVIELHTNAQDEAQLITITGNSIEK